MYNHSFKGRIFLLAPSDSCFLEEFRADKERKESTFKIQGDKAMLSFIYKDELGTGASHN